LVLDLTQRPVMVLPVAREMSRDAGGGVSHAEPLRDLIIAIDPGHGGHDPGAIGPGGTREKDVVLQIARRLAQRVEREPGMRPMLTRTGDYFLPLRERIARARAAQADVFLSIHADAIQNRSVQGSSVYILSERGASSEAARFLAQRENSADLHLGGVPIEAKDDSLTSVLLDLAQSGSLEASHALANRLISELHRVGKVRKPQVERANFAVLRSPDVPSVLVEAAFISNPTEERKLRTDSFQNSLADAILIGLRAYFATHAPPGTLIAEGRLDRHIIRPGETLSTIAERYRMSVAELRAVNDLPGDRIFAGQVLAIPAPGG
jgi:N-acetylmuramoyl-L-alanine amidase